MVKMTNSAMIGLKVSYQMKSSAVLHIFEVKQHIFVLTCIYNHPPSTSCYRNLVSFRKDFQQNIKENRLGINHFFVITDFNMSSTNWVLLNFLQNL